MTDTVKFLIKYEGMDAEASSIHLRYLGQSLIGLDRIISIGLVTSEQGSLPKSRFNVPFIARASVPHKGSFEFQISLEALGILPFISQVSVAYLPEYLRNWISGVILSIGGRRQESLENFMRLTELKEVSDKRKDDIILRLSQNNHEAHMALVQRVTNPAKDALAPVDRSCSTMSVGDGSQMSEFDAATAYAVRSSNQLEVGPMETVTVVVDGLIRNPKQLRVVHPDEPNRIVTAHVRDPSFDIEPNLYLNAMSKRGKLTISCKAARKDGRIQRLYILDATEEA